jgi:hypothetical protein
MYHDLVHSGGQIKAFGMDLNLKLFSVHSSFLAQIPFLVFVLAAVGLQYFQMAQINNRSRKTGQAMPAQQQMMQRSCRSFSHTSTWSSLPLWCCI